MSGRFVFRPGVCVGCPMNLPDSIRQAAEAAAQAFVNECPKYSGYPAHVETYLAAWSECLTHLTTSAGDFDEASADIEAKKLADLFEGSPSRAQLMRRLHGMARWQHAQSAAQLSAMRESLEYCMQNKTKAIDEIARLKSELDELKRTFEFRVQEKNDKLFASWTECEREIARLKADAETRIEYRKVLEVQNKRLIEEKEFAVAEALRLRAELKSLRDMSTWPPYKGDK